MLHAMAHHMTCPGNDFSNRAIINQASGLLMRAAQKGIGRGADAQPFVGGKAGQGGAFVDAEHERFFRIGVLAIFEDRRCDTEMRGWDREIEDDVDIVGLQQIVHRFGAQLELFRPRPRRFPTSPSLPQR